MFSLCQILPFQSVNRQSPLYMKTIGASRNESIHSSIKARRIEVLRTFDDLVSSTPLKEERK